MREVFISQGYGEQGLGMVCWEFSLSLLVPKYLIGYDKQEMACFGDTPNKCKHFETLKQPSCIVCQGSNVSKMNPKKDGLGWP